MFRYLGVNQVRNIDSLYSGENIEINRNLNSEKKEDSVSENQGGIKSTEEGKDSKSNEATCEQRRSHSSEKHSSHSDRHSYKRDDHHKASSSSHHHHYHHKSSSSRTSSSRQQQAHRYQRQLQLDKFNRFRRSVSVEPTAYRAQQRSFIQKPPSGPGYGGRKEWGPQGRRKKRGEREEGWGGHSRGGRGRGKRGGYQGRRGNRRRPNRRNMMDHDDAMDLEMPPPPNQHFRHNLRNNKGFNKPNFNPRPPLLPLPLPPPSSSMMMLPPPPPPPLFDMPPPPIVQRDTSPATVPALPGSSSSEAIQKEKFEHNRMLAEKRDEHSMKEKSLMQDLYMLQSQRAKLLKQHDPHNNKIVKENQKLQDEIRKKIEATRSAIQMLTDIIGDHMKHSTPQISRRAPPSPIHESEDDSSDSRDSDDDNSSQSESESQSHSSQESTDAEQHESGAGSGVFKTPANPGRGRRYKISRNRNIFVRRRDITTRDRRNIDTTSFIQTAGQAVLKSQQQETLQEKSQKMEMKLHQGEDTDNEDIFPLVSSVTATGSTGGSGGGSSTAATSTRTMEEDIEDIFNLRKTPVQRYDEESATEDNEEKKERGDRDEDVVQPPRRKSPTTIIEEIILDGNEDLGGILTRPVDRESLKRRTNIQITLKKRDRRNRCEEKREEKKKEEEKKENEKKEKENEKEEKDLSVHESSASSEKLEVFWCQSCNLEFVADVDYLNHLHSAGHTENSKPEQPWLSQQPAPVAPASPSPQQRHRVCSGSLMLIPVPAWYCKLCHECFVDIRSAAGHLQSPLHWTKLETYTNENPLWEITLLRARTEASSCLKPSNNDEKDINNQDSSAAFKPVSEELNTQDVTTTEHNSPSSKESSNPAEENKSARTSISEMFAEETNENGDKNRLWVPNRKAFDEISKQQQAVESTGKSGKKKPSFIGKMPTGKGKIKIKVGKSSPDCDVSRNNETPSEIDTNLVASVGNILSQLTSIYRVEQEHEEAERERDILYAERQMAIREARKRKQESRSNSRDGSSGSSRDNSVLGRDSQMQEDSSDGKKSENSDEIGESEDEIQKNISRSSRSRSSSRSSTASSTSNMSRSQSSRDNSVDLDMIRKGKKIVQTKKGRIIRKNNDLQESHNNSLSSENQSQENSPTVREPAEYMDFEFDFDSSQEDHPGFHRVEHGIAGSSRRQDESSDDELDVDDKLVDDSDEAEERRASSLNQNVSSASKVSTILENQNDSNVSSRLDIDFFSQSHDNTGNERNDSREKFTNVSGFFEANQHRNHIDTFLTTVGVNSSRLSHEEEESGLSERVESIIKRQQRKEKGLSETSSSQNEDDEQRFGGKDVRENPDYDGIEVDKRDVSVEFMSESDSSETQTRSLSANVHDSRPLDDEILSEEKPEKVYDEENDNIPNPIGFKGAIFFNKENEQQQVQLPFLSEETPGDIFQDCQQLKTKLDRVKERIRADNKRYSSFQDAFRDHRERCAIQMRERYMRKQDDNTFVAPGLSGEEVFSEERDCEEQEDVFEDVLPEKNRGLEDDVRLTEGRVESFSHHRDTETPVGAIFTRNRSKRMSLTEHHRGSDEESCQSFDTGSSKRKRVNKYLEEEEKLKSLEEEEERLRVMEEEQLRKEEEERLRHLKEDTLRLEKKQLEEAEELSRIVKEEKMRQIRLKMLKEKEENRNMRLVAKEEKLKAFEDKRLRLLSERLKKKKQLLEEEKIRRCRNQEEKARQYADSYCSRELTATRQLAASEAVPSQPKRPRRLGNLTSLINRFRFETKISEVDCSEEIDDTIDEIYKVKSHPPATLGFCTSYPTRSEFVNFALRMSSSQTSTRRVSTAMRDIHPDTHFKPIGQLGMMGSAFKELGKEDDPLREHSLYPLTYSHHDGLVSPLERSQRSDVSPEQELSELNQPKLHQSEVIQRNSLIQQEKTIVKKRKKKLDKRQKSNIQRPWSRQSALSELLVAKSELRPTCCDKEEETRSLQSRLSGQVELRGPFLASSFRTSTPSSTVSSTLGQGYVKPSVFEPIEEDTQKSLEDTERYLRDQSVTKFRDASLTRSHIDQKNKPVNVGEDHTLCRPPESKELTENPPMSVRKRRLKQDVSCEKSSLVDVLKRDGSPSQLLRPSKKYPSSASHSDVEAEQEPDIHRGTFHSRETKDTRLALRDQSLSRSRINRSMSRSCLDQLHSRELSLTRPVERKKSVITNVPNEISLAFQDSVEQRRVGTLSQPRSRCEISRPSSILSNHSNLIEATSESNLTTISGKSDVRKASKDINSKRSPSRSILPENASQSSINRAPSQSSLLSTNDDGVHFSCPKKSQSRLSRKDQTLLKSLRGNKPESHRDNRSQIPITSDEEGRKDFQSIQLNNSLNQLAFHRSEEKKKSNVPEITSKKRLSSLARDTRKICSRRDVSEDRASHVSLYSSQTSSMREPSIKRSSEQKYGERSIGSISLRETSGDEDRNLKDARRKKSGRNSSLSVLSTDQRRSEGKTLFEVNQIIREPSVDTKSDVSCVTRRSNPRETSIPRGLTDEGKLSSIDRNSKTHDTRDMSVDRSSSISGSSMDISRRLNRESSVQRILEAQPSNLPSPRTQLSDTKNNRAPSRQAKLSKSRQNIKSLPNSRVDQHQIAKSVHKSDNENDSMRDPSIPKTDKASDTPTKKDSSKPQVESSCHVKNYEGNRNSMDNSSMSNKSDQQNVPKPEVIKNKDLPADDYEQQKEKAAYIENERKRLFARMQELERQIQDAKQGAQKQLGSGSTKATTKVGEDGSLEGNVQVQKRDTRNKKYVNQSSSNMVSAKRNQANTTQGSTQSDSPQSTSKPKKTEIDSCARLEVEKQYGNKVINDAAEGEQNCDGEMSDDRSNNFVESGAKHLKEISMNRTTQPENSSSNESSAQKETRRQDNIKNEQAVSHQQEQQISREISTMKSEDHLAASLQPKVEPVDVYNSAPNMKVEELDDEHSSGSRDNYPGPVHISQYVSSQVVKQEQQAGAASGAAGGTPPLFIPGIFINSNEQFVVKSSTIYKKRAMSKKKRIKAKMKRMMENQQGDGGSAPPTQNPALQ